MAEDARLFAPRSLLRYREEKAELKRRAMQSAQGRINNVLLGGSVKKLYQWNGASGPPRALIDTENPSSFITDPERIKSATVTYFEALYKRTERTPADKPWMDTPSVKRIRESTSGEPFVWPRAMTIDDLHMLLRKGKARPAPGQDGWEKWMIKCLNFSALSLVLEMANYTIVNSHIPDIIKASTLSTLFKRGSPMDLANYRGTCCSKFLIQLPFAWLNHLLIPYLARHSVLPQGQVATQAGVQGRDMISFLAQVETWSTRTKTPIYALRRDQAKGFDRLEPEGFYDAVKAYGLPSSLIDFDRSAQADVPYRVKTAFGLTDEFVISGVSKQGGPLSPLKSVLTTSLGNHWLSDSLAEHGDGLIISSKIGRSGATHHTPDDAISIPLSMVEATDDSIIFTATDNSLSRSCLMMERFQFGYGWITNWSKSLAFALNVPSPPLSIQLPSISLDPQSPDAQIMHDVPVSSSHLDFLRIETNNYDKQFSRLKEIVHSFQFPSLYVSLPFTALRRIISHSLVSKLRPLLSYHPVSEAQATELDHIIAARVHEYFSFPFRCNSVLLSLPISSFGFDFPSIARLNASYAVSGLLRDLNHHIPIFRNMAAVTMADWTCSINGCRWPLDGSSLEGPRPPFLRQTRNLPFQWIVAHASLWKTNTRIHRTDSSFIFTGDVGLRHLLHALPNTALAPTTHNISALEKCGINRLAQIGNWFYDHHLQRPRWIWRNTWVESLRRSAAFTVVHRWVDSWTFDSLANGLVGVEEILMQMDDGEPGDVEDVARDDGHEETSFRTTKSILPFPTDRSSLLIPTHIRKSIAEKTLISLLHCSSLPMLPQRPNDYIYSSDASMIPPNPHFHERRSVLFSCNSPFGSAPFSLSLYRNSASVPLGETYGLVAATLTSLHHSPASINTIFTDHLNSSRLIHDALLHSPLPHAWTSLPARSLYRWILDILHRTNSPPDLTYTPAHTGNADTGSIANQFADIVASQAQRSTLPPSPAPLPTFHMDAYVLYSDTHAYIESNPIAYISSALISQQSSALDFRPSLTMSLPLYDNACPPEHPYTRSSSSYSALVQLYCRSSQLDTRCTRFLRFGDCTPWCSFGCADLETAHHIFVHCPTFGPLRSEVSTQIVRETTKILENADSLTDEEIECLAGRANALLRDGDVWPLGESRFYLGMLPPGRDGAASKTVEARRVKFRVTSSWHTMAIRLAGRIWGEYKRRTRIPWIVRRENSLVLSLPSHLSYMI